MKFIEHDGRWASGAKWWQYVPDIQTSIQPNVCNLWIRLTLTSQVCQKEIDSWYPAKYYDRKGSIAIPIFGSYTHDLRSINIFI